MSENVSYIFEILSKVWFFRLSFVLHMQNVVFSLRIGFSSYIAAVLPRLVINVFKGVSTNVMVNDSQWVGFLRVGANFGVTSYFHSIQTRMYVHNRMWIF